MGDILRKTQVTVEFYKHIFSCCSDAGVFPFKVKEIRYSFVSGGVLVMPGLNTRGELCI